MLDLTRKEQMILELGRSPRLAHEFLFRHRHPEATPPFHFEMVDDLHSAAPRVVELGFRGCGKSTRAEECVIVKALFRRFRNCLVIGESEGRAAERLASIKHELEFNETILEIFGSMVGPVWHETKVELSNGAVIQAFGRGQSLRGVKHNDTRPDFCLIDDIEDEDSVKTPSARNNTEAYLMRTVIPALASITVPVRILANMLDPDCLAARLEKRQTWVTRKYPIEYLDEAGCRCATWPGKFPLREVDAIRSEFLEAGMLNEYMQEYMVQPLDPTTRVFKTEAIKVVPRVHVWEPTYAMYDPARSVKATSAHTGKVVFSWIGTKLVVWEGDGQLWMPNQILDDMFSTQDAYHPVEIGVERDGLEEFIMQPLRAEMTRRRQILPVTPMPAPVGKLAFIQSLQPFFTSGEVEFAKDLPVLKQQLLSFPTGRIDVPNALAYALRMRPGLPIYENFSTRNVVEDLQVLRNTTCYLAIGATTQHTTGVLCQLTGDGLHVLADWVLEGDPGTSLHDILVAARLIAQGRLSAFAGPQHWATFDTIGLQGAARRATTRLSTGGSSIAGREELRRKLLALSHGDPALLVSTEARWTLNAFSGGFCQEHKRGPVIQETPKDGPYRVLMEALESFVAAAAGPIAREGDDKPNYAYDGRGRKYLSALARHR